MKIIHAKFGLLICSFLPFFLQKEKEEERGNGEHENEFPYTILQVCTGTGAKSFATKKVVGLEIGKFAQVQEQNPLQPKRS